MLLLVFSCGAFQQLLYLSRDEAWESINLSIKQNLQKSKKQCRSKTSQCFYFFVHWKLRSWFGVVNVHWPVRERNRRNTFWNLICSLGPRITCASSLWPLPRCHQRMSPTCLSALLYSEIGRLWICRAETLSLRARIAVRVISGRRLRIQV